MTPITAGIIGLVILIILLFSGIPVAFAFALVGLGGFAYLSSTGAALNLLVIDLFHTFSSYSLTVIPMFILMGTFAFYSGASSRLFRTSYIFFGRFPGGLALSAAVTCGAFGAMCGSGSAATAAVGRAALPEMKKYNYDPGLACGCIAAGGPISTTIPPSGAFIIYGIIVSQPISKLFISGILPGILETALIALTVLFLCLRNPKLGPAGGASSFKEKLKAIGGVGEMLVLFILVMGGLYIGVFTPTEAGAAGAAGALIIALVRRGLTWQGFVDALLEAAWITAMIFLIVGGAMMFGHFLAVCRVPFALGTALAALNLPPFATMWLIVLFYLIAGMFVSGLAVLVLTVPILFPVVVALGFDPIWFGVIVVLTGDIGSITPPVGANVYIISGIAPDIPMDTIFRGVFPFIIADIITLSLIMFFPQIALFLPGMMR